MTQMLQTTYIQISLKLHSNDSQTFLQCNITLPTSHSIMKTFSNSTSNNECRKIHSNINVCWEKTLERFFLAS